MIASVGPRYAVYLTPPPDSQFALLGACWLGYDCHRGEATVQADLPGLAETTSTPAQYGFHGTLRAPFELRDHRDPHSLLETTEQFAKSRSALSLTLSLQLLGDFLTLQTDDQAELVALQAGLLAAVEHCRAPLSDYDRARRMRAPLTPSQQALLDEWGYPYVLEELRFHMTLTGPLEADAAPRYQSYAAAHFAPAIETAVTDLGLSVVYQPDRESAFSTLSFYPLG